MNDVYQENRWLRKRVLELEMQLRKEMERSELSIALLITGEQLRERMMFNAILDGCIPSCGGKIKL